MNCQRNVDVNYLTADHFTWEVTQPLSMQMVTR
jgi:hypothetical protein